MQLHQAKDDFEKAGFQVLLVGMGGPGKAERFRRDFAPDYQIICDPEKELYRAYGLSRGTITQMVSPGIFMRGLRTMARGNMPGIPRGDMYQLSGIFLIDSKGNILFSRHSKDASDYPTIDSLLLLKEML